MHGSIFFFSSRRRHTRYWRDWSSDVCSSDLHWLPQELQARRDGLRRGQAGIGRQIERLTEVYLAGVVGLDEYRRRRRDLERREGALARQAPQLEAQVDPQARIARTIGRAHV